MWFCSNLFQHKKTTAKFSKSRFHFCVGLSRCVTVELRVVAVNDEANVRTENDHQMLRQIQIDPKNRRNNSERIRTFRNGKYSLQRIERRCHCADDQREAIQDANLHRKRRRSLQEIVALLIVGLVFGFSDLFYSQLHSNH